MQTSALLRQAARGLRHRPVFTAAAVLSLALGLGACTTVLSVVNALLFKPLPYANPDRLVAIWPTQYFANREVAAIRAQSTSYEQVASLSPGWLMALTGVDVPRQLNGAKVSGNLFAVLGVQPVLGRAFGMEAETPGQDQVVLLSWDLWQQSFGGDRAVIGRSIRLDRQAFTVLGVMPRGFRPFGVTSDLWTAMAMDPDAMAWAGATTQAYGRLRANVTVQAASSELKVVAARIQQEFSLAPNWIQGVSVMGLQASMVGATRPTVLVLLAAVLFLLLIASANVANLLLVRNAERHHELAVRASLGASPADVAALVAAESAVLAVAGGLGGIALAIGGVALLRNILPASLPRVEEIRIDPAVVVVFALLTAIAMLLIGTAPALQARGAALAARMRAGRTIAGQGQRTRGLVVALEVALAVLLTAGATLMGRTLVALHDVSPGFRPDHLLTLRIQPATGVDEELRAFWDNVIPRVRAIPGVSSAATVLHLPTGGRKWNGVVEVEGRLLASGESPRRTAWQSVSAGYFETAGIPLVGGRALDPNDRAGSVPVMVVNSAFARMFFPGESPINHRVRAGNGTQGQWATIVGVVGDVRHDSVNVPGGPEIYVPFAQRPVVATAMLVRTVGNPLDVAAAVRDAIWSVDRNVPISDVRSMEDVLAASFARQRMMLVLLGFFASAGVALSAVGIYGVVAYGVRQRMRELGIRTALGADRAAIHKLVLGQGLRYATAGVLAGIPVALALATLLRTMLFGVRSSDPVSFVAVAVVLLGVALVASWFPARRAGMVDPVEILRE